MKVLNNFFSKLFNMDYKNKFRVFLFSFLVMLFSFAIAFLPYFARGNSFVWNSDGVTQHLPFLEYSNNNDFKNVFTGAFDFKLGLGSDYVFALSYYMLTDPFNIFFFIFSMISTPVAYSITVALKLFTVYYVMFFYLKHKKARPFYAVLGGAMYMLVGTTLFSLPRHPQFAAGMIAFPLMVWGVENVMENKRPYLLIFSVLFCLLSNYYQFYICAICLVIFSLLYYFVLHPKNEFSFKKFAICFLKIAGFSLIGVLLGAIVLMPTLLGMLNSARGSSKGFGLTTGLNAQNLLVLTGEYFFPLDSQSYEMLGLNIALTLIICLYLTSKNRGKILISFFICLMFIPIFGFATNVFNYYAGRWFFILSFLLIVAAIIMLEKLDTTKGKNKLKAVKLFLAFLTIILTLAINNFLSLFLTKISGMLTIFTILIISVIGVCVAILIYKKLKLPSWVGNIFSVKIFIPFLIIATLVNALCFNVFYSQQFATYPNAVESYSFESYVATKNKGKFARVDMGEQMHRNNLNVNKNYLSTFMYNSSSSGEIYNFLSKTGLNNQIGTLGIMGLESRVALQALLNVNYYVATDQNIPFGYEKVDGYDNLYHNQNALEFGTFFSKAMSEKHANSLNQDERANVMLDAVILEDENLTYSPTTQNEQLPFEIEYINCEYKDEKIVAHRNAKITLTISNTLNKEVYLNFKDFGYDWDNVGMAQKLTSGYSRKNFSVETEQRKLDYMLAPPTTNKFNGKTSDYCINLGYNNLNGLSVTINLDEGSYVCKEIYASGYDMQKYQRHIAELKNSPHLNLENFEKYDGRNLAGTIENESEGYLFLSIPYTKGWSASVDGTNAKIMRANYGFMAIKLEAGNHKIELKYNSAGLLSGKIMTIIGGSALAIVVVADIVFTIKNKRKLSEKV